MPDKISRFFLLSATLLVSVTGAALAAPLADSTPLVHGIVSDAVRLTLERDRPGALRTSSDEGALNAGLTLSHIHLELRRSPEKQAALDTLTHDQYTRGSAAFHRWLAPADLRSFGPAREDIDKVELWLTREGLRVNGVSPSGMSIDFGGSVGRVANAFRTPLHYVLRAGEAHMANIAAPSIPAALAPVVTGVTLSDFFPKPAMRRLSPNFTVAGTPYYAVAPPDFATIYNVNPLRGTANFYGEPITGSGVTLAVVEQTLIESSDWLHFRKSFGLAGYPGTLALTHPDGCASPGFTGDEGEAALDAEWSSAVAPSAKILEASCTGRSPFEFGVMEALRNLVEHATPATIFSISYEGDEIANGFAFQEAWNHLVQEGAAEGKAIFVAAGDNATSANEGVLDTNGLFVNGLADTAYNVSVGGTDFYDTALKQNAKYWNKGNSSSLGSAKSYIPEIPWNNSCSSSVIWKFAKYPSALALCNSNYSGPIQNDIGGTGSQSDYYTKPDWQSTRVLGVPNDGVRDQPDVSLFAANGIWNHFYVFCMSDATEGGTPCDYSNANDVFGNAAGGTSFSSPAFAGIAALVQQSLERPGTVFPLGNPAPVFYKIAQAQFTTPLGLRDCNSTLGNKISAACAFNYVTVGDNSAPCKAGTTACATSSLSTKGIGVLEATVGGKHVFAYPAQPGYSLATGLGTVNVTNLLYNYYPGL